jgi:hypothetical protein
MKQNKYLYLYVLQGNYGYGHGWEDLENEGGHYRIIERRELNQ